MIDFSDACILTGSVDNLNTNMVISLDGDEYKVAVCDEAEDDATPKAIKIALRGKIEAKKKDREEKEERLKELLAIVKDLGYELTPTGQNQAVSSSGLIIPTKAQPAPQSLTPPPDLSKSPIVEQKGAKFVVQRDKRSETRIAEGLTPEEARQSLELAKRKSAGAGRRATSSQASRYSSHHLPEEVQLKNGQTFRKPEKTAKKNQVVKGRLGIPTTIPKTLMGTDGTTEIEVVDTGGNEALKRRMAVLNEVRMQQEAAGIMAPDQPIDALNACPSCDGVGKVKGRVCIRCGGVGFMGYV